MNDGKRTAEAQQIRIIAFKDGDMWVAQCLEYDIGAQASDLDTLYTRVMFALDAERKESIARQGKPFAGIEPAPRRFHDMWEKTSGSYAPRDPSKRRADSDVEMALCA